MIIVGVSFNVSMAASSQAGNRHPQTFCKQAVPFVNLVGKKKKKKKKLLHAG